MLKRTAFLVSWLAIVALLPGCGSSSSNVVLPSACTLSGTITDLSGQAANGDILHLYIDTDWNLSTGPTVTYPLTWTGGTGIGNSMNYSVNVKDVAAGTYDLYIFDDSKPPVYGYSNNPTTNAYGNPATVNIDCGATWNLSMDTT